MASEMWEEGVAEKRINIENPESRFAAIERREGRGWDGQLDKEVQGKRVERWFFLFG